MSGLFDMLNARFTGQAEPGLRLRARTTFETDFAGDATLEAQDGEVPAPIPSPLKQDPRTVSQPAAPPAPDPLTSGAHHSDQPTKAEPNAPERADTNAEYMAASHPAARDVTPEQVIATEETEPVRRRAADTWELTTEPPSHAISSRNGVAHGEIEEPPPEIELARDQARAPIVETPPPIQTQLPTLMPESIAQPDAPAPEPAAPTVTVKIGKIEVKAPQKQTVPAPEPRPATPAPRPVDRAAHQSSKLTNYLGWKR
ncbi:MAG: hypothetical protein AAGA70_04410 [Pseudomonadota bacterium]